MLNEILVESKNIIMTEFWVENDIFILVYYFTF